jgi:hypothetical protein
MLIFAKIAHGILHQFECHVVLVVNHMNKSRGVIIAKKCRYMYYEVLFKVVSNTHSCLKPVNHCLNLGVREDMEYGI